MIMFPETTFLKDRNLGNYYDGMLKIHGSFDSSCSKNLQMLREFHAHDILGFTKLQN